MTKTKLRVAAAMLAVLLLTCAWVGAVSAVPSINLNGFPTTLTDELKYNGFFITTDNKLWLPSDYSGTPGVPFNVSGSGYLDAFNITGTNTSSLYGFNYTGKFSDGWAPVPNFASGKWYLASTAHGTTSKELSSEETSLFSVNISNGVAARTDAYSIEVEGLMAGMHDSAIVSSTGDIILKTVTYTNDNFTFYVYTKPEITGFNITNYTGLSSKVGNVKFYLFTGTSPSELKVEGTNSNAVSTEYKFALSESAITANPLTVTSTNFDNVKTLLTHLTPGDYEFTASADGVDSKSVNLNVSNWVKAQTDNYGSNEGTGEITGKWSDFKTNRTITYTVAAGPEGWSVGEWNSTVSLKLLTKGDGTSPKNATSEWVPSVSYETVGGNPITGDNFMIKLSGTSNIINVTKCNNGNGDVPGADGALNIIFTGYPLGDANTDGGVNIVDSAVLGIQMIKGNPAPGASGFLTAEQYIYADCGSATPDGIITVADILAINKFIVGYTSPWSSTP